jgi:small subunit ribosomal protein S16
LVTIRLARHGGKKHPFYHVTVAEKTAKRDGRFIERIGFYNPLARGQEEVLRIDIERADYWLGSGAQPTERVRRLIARWRKLQASAADLPAAAAPAAEAAPA